MRQNFLAMIFTAPMIAIGAVTVFSKPNLAKDVNTQLICQTDEFPTIVASIPNRDSDVTLLKFMEKYFSSGDEALLNCQTTANTLQTLYNNDTLFFLATDTVEGQSVVCAVKGLTLCNSDDALILFTLDNKVNPVTGLYNMLGSCFVAGDPPKHTLKRIYADIGNPSRCLRRTTPIW